MKYEDYLKEEGVRKISKNTFNVYMSKFKWDYNKVIEYLKKPKNYANNRKNKFKINPEEVREMHKIIKKKRALAKYFNVNLRTIYRYLSKYF
jgi:cytochrome c2